MTEETKDSETLAKAILLLRSREQVGLRKYGISLDRKDLTARQWLTHMLEEMLDGVGYAIRTLETMPESVRDAAQTEEIEGMFKYPTIHEGQRRGQRIREDQYEGGSFKQTYAIGYNDGLTDAKPEDITMYRALREIVESIRYPDRTGTIMTPGAVANIASIALSTLPPDSISSYERYDELKLDAERYRTLVRLGDADVNHTTDEAELHLRIPYSLPDGFDSLDQLVDAIMAEENAELERTMRDRESEQMDELAANNKNKETP